MFTFILSYPFFFVYFFSIAPIRWYTKAAEQGDSIAQYYLGLMYKAGFGVSIDYEEAAKWYTKSAEQGYAQAQYDLGYLYYYGKLPENYEEAFKWFRKAADQGSADAQCKLGEMYDDGKGVEKSENTALEWYRKAEAQEDEWATMKIKFILSRHKKKTLFDKISEYL